MREMPEIPYLPFTTIRARLWDPRLIRIAVASVVTGLLIGVVGGSFRWCLDRAETERDHIVAWSHGNPYVGWIVPVVVTVVAVVIARLLVLKVAPEAAGSGIQRVEAVMAGQTGPTSSKVLPVKYVGGLLALGAGMVLGREGPTVQMGASLGEIVSPIWVKDRKDQLVVLAAGAGAGLAVAFNAPIGGSVFVFEELTSSFTPWLLVATLSAATFAVGTMRWMIGNQYVFFVIPSLLPSAPITWHYLAMGGLLGAVGAGYNRLSTWLLDLTERFARYPAVARSAVIAAVVGLVAYFSPAIVGGGDNLTQSILSGKVPLRALGLVFLVRFWLGPWSYAAETPGGMFAPLLVLGTAFGAFYGGVVHRFQPQIATTVTDFAIVGMVALFAACVRAPLTGVVLAIEMTGRGDLSLGMVASALGAMLVAMLLKSPPIYESLRLRMLARERPQVEASAGI